MGEAAALLASVLGALALLCGPLVAAAAIVHRASLTRGPVRLAGGAIATAFLLTAGFHGLLLAGAFRLGPALAYSALLTLAGVLLHPRPAGRWRPGTSLHHDLVLTVRLWSGGRTLERAFASIVGVSVVLVSARALILPPLGWDTLTSHGVKAALWVQTGAAIHFPAPGGWGFSQYYLGGSDLLLAWAMLPFRAFTWFALPDVLALLLWGLGHYRLAREAGLRASSARIAAGALTLLPAVTRAVGSGYSELWLGAMLSSGLAFLIRGMRRERPAEMLLGFAALGLAAGTKLTALPVAAGVLAVCVVQLARRPRTGACVAAGAGLVLAPVVPWCVVTLRETGWLFGYSPVHVGPWVLGGTTAALRWYMDRPAMPAGFALHDELGALHMMFRLPWESGLHLDLLTLAIAALAPWGAWRIARRDPYAAGVLVVAALTALAGYVAPDFKVVRLNWSASNARFLFTSAALGLVVGLRALPATGRLRRATEAALMLTAVGHAGVLFAGYGAWEWAWLAPAAVVLAACTAWSMRAPPPRGLGPSRLLEAALLSLALTAGLELARAAVHDRACARAIVLHDVPREWRTAAAALERQPGPCVIAITSGMVQNADNWFLLPLFGARLQHRLLHVPSSPDGRIVDFSPTPPAFTQAGLERWRERLVAARATHVMSFGPASAELPWLERDPAHFERLAGDGTRWGLYRCLAAPEVAPAGVAAGALGR